MKGWTPQGQEHYQNEQAWRKAGLSERLDRNSPDRSLRWRIAQEASRKHGKHNDGTGWSEWAGALRPLPHRIYARREPAYQGMVAIPDIVNRYEGQQAGAVFEVLAVGEGVVSCRVGDRVVASSYVGEFMGDTLGPDIFALWCDVAEVNDGHSDTERRTGGDVLAVLDTE